MNRNVFIEGTVVFIIGVVTVVEGFRLSFMQKIQLYDVFGPGNYTIGVGLCLLILGPAYFLSHRKDIPDQAEPVDKMLRNKLFSMIAILVVYIILMNIIGYLFSTLLFFLLIFRIAGYSSWPVIVPMSIGITGFLYIAFGHWLHMPLPQSIFIP